ncbi:unnamed protein product [Caenorhabditis nigoni]
MNQTLCNKLCPEVERLLRAKNEEICVLRRVIRHQDEITKFVDGKMREIRLENEKLQKRNEELENFYRANNTRVVFKKRNPLDALTTETEPSKIDNQKTNQDLADRKKESEKEHIDTGRTLKKDTNTSEREQRKESNNKIPHSSIITGPLMTPTDATFITANANLNTNRMDHRQLSMESLGLRNKKMANWIIHQKNNCIWLFLII